MKDGGGDSGVPGNAFFALSKFKRHRRRYGSV